MAKNPPGARREVPRSRGALSGIALMALGAWGALIPFIGPYFNFSFTPDDAWHWTAARGWLEVLPGVAAFVGGFLLLVSKSRSMTLVAAWLGIAAGAWFAVGPQLQDVWHIGSPGQPAGSGDGVRALEALALFTLLGVVIVYFAATAFGRLSVVSLRDAHAAERRETAAAEEAERERQAAAARDRDAAAAREREAAEAAAARDRDAAAAREREAAEAAAARDRDAAAAREREAADNNNDVRDDNLRDDVRHEDGVVDDRRSGRHDADQGYRTDTPSDDHNRVVAPAQDHRAHGSHAVTRDDTDQQAPIEQPRTTGQPQAFVPQQAEAQPGFPQQTEAQPSFPQQTEAQPGLPQQTQAQPGFPQQTEGQPADPEQGYAQPQRYDPQHGYDQPVPEQGEQNVPHESLGRRLFHRR